jgi:Omptin family
MNDEDWGIIPTVNGIGPPFIGYSNTASTVDGSMRYGTIDIGYDVLRGRTYKVGAFVGYNQYKDDKNAFGCTQIANPFSDCNPAAPANQLGITEDDTWRSLRVGLNGEARIANGVKLIADVAYLPYVSFNGVDNHLQRIPPLVINETGTGIGTQAEVLLSVDLTSQLSVGAGARYWAMWTTSGSDCFEPCGPPPYQAAQYKTERYGLFLQGSYQFQGPADLQPLK